MSLNLKVYNQSAEAVKEIKLEASVFGVAVKPELIHQAAVAQANNARQVLANTKDRSEVSGGGKKPWKQKGTGRARVGSSRSPLWRGGGIIFGPTKDRNFKQKINQKMKQKAICMALSDKVSGDSLLVLDKLDFSQYKTKAFNAMLTAFENKVLNDTRRDILILNDAKDDKVKYSGRNLAGVKIINLENLNLLDLLNYRRALLTEAAVTRLSQLYGKKQ